MKHTDGRKRAAALKYTEHLPAPFIIAKGRGELAEKLQRMAEEHGVPVQEDPELSELLDVLEIGEIIPEELYEIIAELYTFVIRMQDEL
jgi:flagellar biosynthesis protein